MANVDAATLTTEIINLWHPRALILVGIAGAASDGTHADDESLGDLVLGSNVFYCERGKQIAQGQLRREPYMIPSSQKLWSCVTSISDWDLDVSEPRPDHKKTHPKTFQGVIATGEKVIADAVVRNEIKSEQRKIRAIEMESYGFSKAVYQKCGEEGKHIEHLVMKAICDRADRNKDEDWQPYAAAVAASGVKHFLLDCLSHNLVPPRNRPTSSPLPNKLIEDYRTISRNFSWDNVVPFLGSGVNLFNRFPILDVKREDHPEYPLTLEEYLSEPTNDSLSEIEVTLLLSEEIKKQKGDGNSQDLVARLMGFPCIFCHLAVEDRPEECPVKAKIKSGERFWECPLFAEQSLAVSKTNLRFLSQHFQIITQNPSNLFKQILDFLQHSSPNRLHYFFANLIKNS